MMERDLTCPQCGKAEMVEWEWKEVAVPFQDQQIETIIPVQTCTFCQESFTDFIAELIQDGATLPLREKVYQEQLAHLQQENADLKSEVERLEARIAAEVQFTKDILEAKKTHWVDTKGGDFKAHVVYDTGSWLIGFVDSECGFTTLHWDYDGTVMAADPRFDLTKEGVEAVLHIEEPTHD